LFGHRGLREKIGLLCGLEFEVLEGLEDRFEALKERFEGLENGMVKSL
jgi:hypothetical protein